MDAKKRLAEILRESDNIVFLGGAGVSTESGIPDFRSESGIYTAIEEFGHRPETLLSRSFFDSRPQAFYSFYRTMLHQDAQPNKAHKALALLESQKKLTAIITQNIDGLHQKAGSKRVLELHGSVLRYNCMKCRQAYGLDVLVRKIGKEGQANIPYCDRCGGIIKPDVVLYEEPLDARIMEESIKAVRQAEVLIVGGTSLVVYPAAGLVDYFAGKELVLINISETPYDHSASLHIREPIGQVLDEAVRG